MFSHGNGFADRVVIFTGNLSDINAAVGLLTYTPDLNFNSMQHVELLTIAIWQMASSEAKVEM